MTNKFIIIENKKIKCLRSQEYCYNFDKQSGFFARWGRTKEEDPSWSPFGPEIMDIEISEGEGCPMSCPWCYKGNKKGNNAVNMSFDTFKKLFSTFPKTITQIAFGITSVGSHPELFDFFQFCRNNGVIPNVTINGADPLTNEQITKLVNVCGAMAVSINQQNYERGLNLIERLTNNGGQQINIHYVISKQTIEFAYTICNSIKKDPRLSKMNAIVFLGLKPKNRGQSFDVLKVEDYIKLVNYCLKTNIRFGFDSCSAPRFDKAIEISSLNEAKKKLLQQCSERCESGLFSAYIDASGKYWHCSFGEGRNDAYGIDVTQVNDFTEEVWLSQPMKEWRNKLWNLKRECPLYPEIRVEK
jgi:sulfatase maturation enzyme AslB (radical SAM superfamily)